MLAMRGRGGGGGGGARPPETRGGVGAPLTPALAGGEGRQRLYAAAIRPVGAFARTLHRKRTKTRETRCFNVTASSPLLLSLPSSQIRRIESNRSQKGEEIARSKKEKKKKKKTGKLERNLLHPEKLQCEAGSQLADRVIQLFLEKNKPSRRRFLRWSVTACTKNKSLLSR